MSVSYNLRSLQRKKGISVGHCYLQDFLENKSPDVFNPKVRLERLKLLECHDVQNSRFYLDKGRITIKPNKSNLLNKKYFLKILCSVIIFVIFSFYWRDYLQSYGTILAKKYAEIHPEIQNYYSDVLKLPYRIWRQSNFKEKKSNIEDRESVSAAPEGEFIQMHDDFHIRKLVRDYFEEVKKLDYIKSKRKPPKSFIEDQCKSNTENKFSSVKNSFYNVTLPELFNFTDYALESQGAKIVTAFNTEPYGTISVKFLNFNLQPEIAQFLMKYFKCFSSNGPNSVLVPWKKPGDCWAFKGSYGRVQIELSKKIVITAVTIDHIPKEVAPNGSIQSALKEFTVVGVEKCKNQICRTHLGSFEYMNTGSPSQTFYIRDKVEIPFQRIEVVIQSNHGNEKYTCIYKIRVHGYE